MIVEAFENYTRFNGPWLQGWAEMNSAAIASARIAFGQLELAALASRFMSRTRSGVIPQILGGNAHPAHDLCIVRSQGKRARQ